MRPSVVSNNRPAGLTDGWCDAGCPIRALAHPLVFHLPQALQAGARRRPDHSVTRVLTSLHGDRATGVEDDDAHGRRHVQQAEGVILAAVAIHNPRGLLTSSTPQHPGGLANASGLLGRSITHMRLCWFSRGSRSPPPWKSMFPEEGTRFFSLHTLSARLVSHALLT